MMYNCILLDFVRSTIGYICISSCNFLLSRTAFDVCRRKLETIGEIKELSYPRVVFSVKRKKASEITAEVLDKLPVADLNVEEPPIEDVIRELFTGKDYA